MEGKRRLRRRYLVAEVKVRGEAEGPWIQAVLMNINRGGIGLYATRPLRQKERVSVKITYLDGTDMKEVEEIPGSVRWTLAIGEHYAAGIMFEKSVDKKNFPVLSKCLTYAKGNK